MKGFFAFYMQKVWNNITFKLADYYNKKKAQLKVGLRLLVKNIITV